MELGDAAEGQGILDPAAFCGGDHLGIGQQVPDVFRRFGLIRMGPDRHHPGVEGIHHPLEDLQAHSPHHIGGPGRLEHVIEPDGSQGRGGSGAGCGRRAGAE